MNIYLTIHLMQIFVIKIKIKLNQILKILLINNEFK